VAPDVSVVFKAFVISPIDTDELDGFGSCVDFRVDDAVELISVILNSVFSSWNASSTRTDSLDSAFSSWNVSSTRKDSLDSAFSSWNASSTLKDELESSKTARVSFNAE